MPDFDDSLVTAHHAAEHEVERRGDRSVGSAHVLVGLLAIGGVVVEAVQRAEPALTVTAAREALDRDADDLPHLERLGVDPERVLASAGPPSPGPRPKVRHFYAAEFQQAMAPASAKLARLRKAGDLTHERKPGSAVLWLQVLEPGTRATQLLAAMDVSPDRLREAVLITLTSPGRPIPTWPSMSRPSTAWRLTDAFLRRFSAR